MTKVSRSDTAFPSLRAARAPTFMIATSTVSPPVHAPPIRNWRLTSHHSVTRSSRSGITDMMQSMLRSLEPIAKPMQSLLRSLQPMRRCSDRVRTMLLPLQILEQIQGMHDAIDPSIEVTDKTCREVRLFRTNANPLGITQNIPRDECSRSRQQVGERLVTGISEVKGEVQKAGESATRNALKLRKQLRESEKHKNRGDWWLACIQILSSVIALYLSLN